MLPSVLKESTFAAGFDYRVSTSVGRNPYEYSEAEEQQLQRQLHALTKAVYAGTYRDRPLSVELLQDLHAGLFLGVRDHAGKIRSNEHGSETLTFGPNRSTHRDRVRAALDSIFVELSRAIASLDANRTDEAYERSAVHIAVWTHAEIIRVHPFEDGNGRTARLLMNCILLRVGLLPVQMEVPKQEYRECLNHYYSHSEIQPIVDLVLGLYPLP